MRRSRYRGTVMLWLVLVTFTDCAPGGAAAQPAAIDTTAGAAPPATPALDGRLRVPAGFKVAYFARLPGPRFMALGPDGAVYVSQTGSDRVVRLADVNGDGAADSQSVAVDGLDGPH